MRKLGLAAALAATVAVAGCSTYGPGYGYDPYYGGPYVSYGDRLPYVCGLYGYCN